MSAVLNREKWCQFLQLCISCGAAQPEITALLWQLPSEAEQDGSVSAGTGSRTSLTSGLSAELPEGLVVALSGCIAI